MLNYPLRALVHLGLARAYALSGETEKARSAYRDFFKLWKDADPDIPILRRARAEYEKLDYLEIQPRGSSIDRLQRF